MRTSVQHKQGEQLRQWIANGCQLSGTTTNDVVVHDTVKFRPFSDGENYHADIQDPRYVNFNEREKDAAWLLRIQKSVVEGLQYDARLDAPKSFYRTEPEELVPNDSGILAVRQRQAEELAGMTKRTGYKKWGWAPIPINMRARVSRYVGDKS